jgi:hypothetical protein
MNEQKTGRRRRSSSLLYQEPPETIEHMSDQAALPNLNANWVNAKGSLFLSLMEEALSPPPHSLLSPATVKGPIQLELALLTFLSLKVPGQYIWY